MCPLELSIVLVPNSKYQSLIYSFFLLLEDWNILLKTHDAKEAKIQAGKCRGKIFTAPHKAGLTAILWLFKFYTLITNTKLQKISGS